MTFRPAPVGVSLPRAGEWMGYDEGLGLAALVGCESCGVHLVVAKAIEPDGTVRSPLACLEGRLEGWQA